MILKCKQCEKEFELTDSEIEFYRSKGLELPKRCKPCRDENKARKRMTGSTHGGSRPYGTGSRYNEGRKNGTSPAGAYRDSSSGNESKSGAGAAHTADKSDEAGLSGSEDRSSGSFSGNAGKSGGFPADADRTNRAGSAGDESKGSSAGIFNRADGRNGAGGSGASAGGAGGAATGSTEKADNAGTARRQGVAGGRKKWTIALVAAMLLVVLFIAGKYLGGDTEQPADVTGSRITPSEDAPTPESTPIPEGTSAPADAPTPESTPIPEGTSAPADTPTPEITDAAQDTAAGGQGKVEILYNFRRDEYLQQHFEKHGGEFDYGTAEEYLAGANRVIQSPEALHKLEAEDGDDIYYLEETNEFVVVSTDGYIRTYFRPDKGIDYYNRQ